MQELSKILQGMETSLTGLLALAAALLTVGEAVVRYISPASLPDWSAEVTIYCVGWAVMLSAGRLVRDDKHVCVDMLVDILSPRIQRISEIFVCIFGIVVTIGIAYASLRMVEFAIQFSERSDSSIRFPMWLYYVAIPVGFGLSAVQYLIRFVQLLTGRRV